MYLLKEYSVNNGHNTVALKQNKNVIILNTFDKHPIYKPER